MAIKTWETVFPASTDSTTEMPDLTGSVDNTGVSQIHSIRDAVISLETLVGDDTAASGTLRNSLGSLYGGVGYVTVSGEPPAPSPSTGTLYTADVGGVFELHYQDSDGSSTQLTSSGALDLSSVIDTSVSGTTGVWDGSTYLTGFYDALDDYLIDPRWTVVSGAVGSTIEETTALRIGFGGGGGANIPNVDATLQPSNYCSVEWYFDHVVVNADSYVALGLLEVDDSGVDQGVYTYKAYTSGQHQLWIRTFGNGSQQDNYSYNIGQAYGWCKLITVYGAGWYLAYSLNAKDDYPGAQDWKLMHTTIADLQTSAGRLVTPNTLRFYAFGWTGNAVTIDYNYLKLTYG